MRMYTIRDSVTDKFFGRIFLFENDNQAVRVFKDTLMNADDPMGQHPDDYTMYYVGDYNDDEGIPKGCDPLRVMTGVEAIKLAKIDQDKLRALHQEIDNIKAGNGSDHGITVFPEETDHAQ